MDLGKCRLCLDAEAITSIFKKRGELMISSEIMSLTKVVINPDDGLPDKVCLECIEKLDACLDFIKQCKSSDLHLRGIFKNIHSSISDNLTSQNTINSKNIGIKNEIGNTDSVFEEIVSIEHSVMHKRVITTDKNGKTDLHSENKTRRKAQKEQCSICGKVLSSKFRLKMHQRIHTGEKPFSCPHCGKQFTLSQNLKVHLRIHTGEKPLECTICGVLFAHSSGLLAHRRKHSGQLPYRCTLCPRSFRTVGHLQYHIRRHTGETSFECDSCSRAFITRTELKQHILSHTGEKPHVCCVCGSRFARASNLRRHVKHQHNGDKPFTCNVCSHKFAQKSDFQRHKKKHNK